MTTPSHSLGITRPSCWCSMSVFISAFYIDESYKKIAGSSGLTPCKSSGNFAKRLTRTKVQPQCVVHEGCRLSESSLYSDRILSFAEAQAVNLIVMGTHGLGGVDRLKLGSVTEKFCEKPMPGVSGAKAHARFVSPGEKLIPSTSRRLFLCMDFSKHAQRALSHAFSIAKQYNAELTLLHCWNTHRLGGHSKHDS